MAPSVDPTRFDEELLQQYRAYLKLMASARLSPQLQSQIDASDLVQQTLHDAVAGAEQYQGTEDAELFSWLRKILANNLIDAIRYCRRDKRDLARTRSLEESVFESFCRVDLLAESCSTPSQHAAKNELLLRLPEALDALSETQREAIVLHHLQGLKLSETAKQMNKSESAVCGLLHRGLKKLHQVLGD